MTEVYRVYRVYSDWCLPWENTQVFETKELALDKFQNDPEIIVAIEEMSMTVDDFFKQNWLLIDPVEVITA